MAALHVFYQFNQNYVPYAGVSITSLFENNRDAEEITIYLLLENVAPESVAMFEKLAEQYGRKVVVVPAEQLLRQVEMLGIPKYRGSSAANLRLFFPDEVPDSVRRLLYLDSDTVICGSLQSLAETPLDGNWIGMVRDSMTGDYPRILGFAPEDAYCNSGMVLFDVPAWKQNGCSEKIVQHVKTVRAGYPNPDQDLLNVALKGHIAVLGPQYNFQPCHRAYSDKTFFACRGNIGYYTLQELEAARKHPVVLHTYRFLGEFPWHSGNIHPDNAQFDHYLALSPWQDYQKKPAENGVLFKMEKLLYRILPRSIFFRILMIQQQRAFRASEKALRNAQMAE